MSVAAATPSTLEPATTAARPATSPGPAVGAPAGDPELRRATFTDVSDIGSAAAFVGGAVSAFALHESGHVITNLLYGNVPTITPITYGGVVPFFVVDAKLTDVNGAYYKRDGKVFPGGRHAYYIINTAGFQMQNLTSEIILSGAPNLRYEWAPYRKGMLLMNVALSLGYGTAALVRVEDPHGDLAGASQRAAYTRDELAVAVIAPAALDLLRYIYPENSWLPWLSRGTKTLFLGMDINF